jgi:hypothetical protein
MNGFGESCAAIASGNANAAVPWQVDAAMSVEWFSQQGLVSLVVKL